MLLYSSIKIGKKLRNLQYFENSNFFKSHFVVIRQFAMRCAVKNCSVSDDETLCTQPCTTCGKPTHHICANNVHEDDNIGLRYCSLACLLEPQESSQRVDVSAYVKVKQVSKIKTTKSKKVVATGQPKAKRRSVLDELRRSYVGKVLDLSGAEMNATDDNIYTFQVTDVNRKRLAGDLKLTQVVALCCETNPLMSLADVPLDTLRKRLDAAPFDERRVLNMEITEEASQRLIEAKRNKRRKLIVASPVATSSLAPVTNHVQQSTVHEYSDEDDDDDFNGSGFTLLDSILEGRRGFDVDEVEPQLDALIAEPPDMSSKTVEETQWTRCGFNDVPVDDPEGYTQATRASQEAIEASASPLQLFLYILPHSFWEYIARCSDMKRVSLLAKIEGQRNDMKYMMKPIVASRVFSFVLVLILNMLQPFAGGMSNHWRTEETFIRRPGTVSMVMSRDEFSTISCCLCFYEPSSLDPGDKFTKIRYLIDALNKQFQRAIRLGAFVSFDEATFASRSTYIPARQYNPLKPKKFGLKLFMLCEALCGYCFRFEIYQGKYAPSMPDVDAQVAAAHNDEPVAILSDEPVGRLDDTLTGPAALLRNCAWMQGSHRTVFCDRFYTSVGLFLKLKELGINAVGTIMGNRKGFSSLVKFNSHEVKTEPRGSLKMMRHQIEGTTENILSIGWLDTKPVYLIATGVASTGCHIVRRLKRGVNKVLSACRPIQLYQQYMGGVDTHDYMRMGTYSLQKTYKMRYWPKTMFLALMDLVLVNLYIIWKLIHLKTPKMKTREDFYSYLAEEMHFYKGFDPVPLTRAASKSTMTASPAVTPKGKRDREVAPCDFEGHDPAKLLPKQKIAKTRANAKMLQYESYKYGNSGSGFKYRRCFICTRMGRKRYDTAHYCTNCRVPVCRDVIRYDRDNIRFNCWNELHCNPKFRRLLEKREAAILRL